MTDKIKVCAYCRVSTDSKDQKNSFENQKKYFNDYISNNNDYELFEIYADQGITGTSWNKRKAFLQMLEDAGIDAEKGKRDYEFITENDREPKFRKILIKDVTRFARDIDAIRVFRALIRKGVSLVLPTAGKEFASLSDEMYLSMLLTFAQEESRDRSKKIKFGHEQGANKGNIFTTKKIYGYYYDLENKELSIIEDEAEVIRKIYDLYVNKNLGIRRILEVLDKEEIKTRNGKAFSKSSIGRILTNEKYYGALVRNKYDTGEVFNKKSVKVRPQKEWIIKEDRIPAIVTKEMFEKAQNKRESRITISGNGKNYATNEYAGLIRCEKCNSNYIRNVDKGRVFYNCATKKQKGIRVCDNPNVNLTEIEKAISKLQKYALAETFENHQEGTIEILQELGKELIAKIDVDTDEIIEEKKSNLVKLQEKKNRFFDLFGDGMFSKKDLSKKVNEVQLQIDELEKEINELSKSNDELNAEIDEISTHIEELMEMKVKKKYTKEEVLNEVNVMTISNDEIYADSFVIDFRFKSNELIKRIIEKYGSKINFIDYGFGHKIKLPKNYVSHTSS